MKLYAKSDAQIRREILDRLAPRMQSIHANKDGIVISEAMRRFNAAVQASDTWLPYCATPDLDIAEMYRSLFRFRMDLAQELREAAQAVGMWQE